MLITGTSYFQGSIGSHRSELLIIIIILAVTNNTQSSHGGNTHKDNNHFLVRLDADFGVSPLSVAFRFCATQHTRTR